MKIAHFPLNSSRMEHTALIGCTNDTFLYYIMYDIYEVYGYIKIPVKSQDPIILRSLFMTWLEGERGYIAYLGKGIFGTVYHKVHAMHRQAVK